MESFNKKLTIISYNSEHADDVRLPCLQGLFEKCDFLMLQEHGLYQSKLGWLNAVGKDIGSSYQSAQYLLGPSHFLLPHDTKLECQTTMGCHTTLGCHSKNKITF